MRTWSSLLFVPSSLDIFTILLAVKSSSLCTISTVMSWKHKLQDSCKGKAIFSILFHFWFIMGGVQYCFSHFWYTPMAPVIVIGLILALIFNTDKEKYKRG